MKTKRKTSYLAYERSKVPYIRISGHWLSEVGFNIGNDFVLAIDNNQITLTPLSKNSNGTNTLISRSGEL